MEKEKFEKLINALNIRINKCHEYLDDIKTTEDLKNISIKRALEVREFCIQEVDLQTKALMCDLYHIIGMGNLTVIQMNLFLKLIKEYSTFRPDLKALATKLESLSELPELPAKTKYRLQVLGGITLHRNTRDGDSEVEEIEMPEDYKDARNVSLPEEDKPAIEQVELDFVQIRENKITIDVSEDREERAEQFVHAINLGGNGLELIRKATVSGAYLGMSLTLKNNIITGIMTKPTKNHIAKYIK